MKENPTNEVLMVMLKNIDEKIDEIHKKQDYTNGKVQLNTEFRNKSEGVLSLLKWLGVSNVITFLYFLSQVIK